MKGNYMKVLITVLIALFVSASAFAKGATVKVNGMVCSFCSTSIEKKFKEKSEVGEVKVDLETKKVTLMFAADKSLTDDQIKDVIKKSGYAVESIERNDK
jgi:copper chaperone CopZ